MNLRYHQLNAFSIRGLAATAALFAACSGSGGEDIFSGPEPVLIVTYVSAEPDTIGPGGRTTIRIQVSNLGSESLILDFDDQNIYGIEIADTGGSVMLFPCMSDSIARRVIINPGDRRVAVIPFWAAGANGFCAPYTSDTLSPGYYTVRGGLRGYGAIHPWGRDGLTVIE